MYRDGEILKIPCSKCGKIKELKYHNKEKFGKVVSGNPGEISSQIYCEGCGEELQFPEN